MERTMDRPRPKSAGAIPRSKTPSLSVSTPTPTRRPTTPVRAVLVSSPTSAFWSGGSPKSDTGITNDMLDAKLTRKRAESDMQLLSNRIALLRMEEQKALQKVSETQLRTNELAEIKKRNEDTIKDRMQKTLARENRIRENQIRAQNEREERQRKLQLSKQSAAESRRALVQEVLDEKRRLSAVLHEGKNYAEQEKFNRVQEIRQRRRSAQEDRERLRLEKERAAQEQYMRKIAEETLRKRQAESVIQQMEQEERNLISRLRRTQHMQEQAYAALQTTLRS